MTEQKRGPGAWAAAHRTGLRRLGKGLLWGAGLLGVLLACFLGYTLATAPDLDRVDVSPQGYRTTVMDDRGETILTLMGEASNRVYVPIDRIPKDLQNAVVALSLIHISEPTRPY